MSNSACPFCELDPERVVHESALVRVVWDAFPVSEGHALVVTRRHVASFFDATRDEQSEILAALAIAKEAVTARHHPDGFNVGVNIGETAGQTIPHLHVHLIPRYDHDVFDPRGGVRHVIPARANYLRPADLGPNLNPGRVAEASATFGTAEPSPLVRGDDDPLLPWLASHLDHAESADLLASFILSSGITLLQGHLLDLLDRGGHVRILTGDYLGITEPEALLRLLDLGQGTRGTLELRAFESRGRSFHPKAYLFHGSFDRFGHGVAYVGSSNLSRAALKDSVEWNYRVVPARREGGPGRRAFATLVQEFERLFAHPQSVPVTSEWIERYRERRPKERQPIVGVPPEPPPEIPAPHDIQTEALDALERTRTDGNEAGLVVLATGLGKTWLAAFDTQRVGAKRVLFVAHREEILRQALTTFRRIRPDADLGLYTGAEKAPDADVLFASVQTLGKANHLRRFAPQAFDYIVIDEFHHAAARTYRRLINHFEPAFLLGLTATPERTDGGDLLGLCSENLVYRCDVLEGIERERLSPFRYVGVPDEVDYQNIPWRSSRFDEEALTNAVATTKRADNALDQHHKHAGTRSLAFCCSQRHADFMAKHFRDANIPSASVHTGATGEPRTSALERLDSGELHVIFAVDLFNEGVDLPAIDTILMLRPTESRILWLQQFGRGLRLSEDKERLTVIDYIGNHRTFLIQAETLFGLEHGGDRAITDALRQLERGELELPPGCEITYELEAVDILKSLLRTPKAPEALRQWYESYREEHGERPTALQTHHAGYNPRAAAKTHGSWTGYLDAMGDLSPAQKTVLKDKAARALLSGLETTPMTKSYKMLTLVAMLNADRVPGEMSIEELAEGFARLARRNAPLRADVGDSLDDADALRKHLEKNPIAAWTGGKGTKGRKLFAYDGEVFRTTFTTDDASQREAFQELARELADWRLGEYLDRQKNAEGDEILCKVSHTNRRPMLFVRPGLTPAPLGPTPVTINGEPHIAKFVKIAVNVVHREDDESRKNILPDILEGWFGPDAGLPGTNHHAAFRRRGKVWRLEPRRD